MTRDGARSTSMSGKLEDAARKFFFSREMRDLGATGLYGVEPTIVLLQIAQVVDNSKASTQA